MNSGKTVATRPTRSFVPTAPNSRKAGLRIQESGEVSSTANFVRRKTMQLASRFASHSPVLRSDVLCRMTKSEPSPHPSLLLERTTRRLSLTEEGADFYGSCVRVLAELDEAEARAASRRREVAGTLRISLPVSLGRRWVMSPSLNLAKQHSQLHLEVRFSNRVVDLLEEGIDMVVRLGEPGNSAFLASRCLGHQRVVTCASPAYLADRGLLACVSDLAAHDCLTFASAGGVLRCRKARRVLQVC